MGATIPVPIQVSKCVKQYVCFRTPSLIFCLGEDASLVYNARHRENIKLEHPGRSAFRVSEQNLKESLDMKKLLTVLFAVALTFSLSAVSFAQDKTPDKKEDKAEKKAAKKKAKKEKKADKKEEKKDQMK